MKNTILEIFNAQTEIFAYESKAKQNTYWQLGLRPWILRLYQGPRLCNFLLNVKFKF